MIVDIDKIKSLYQLKLKDLINDLDKKNRKIFISYVCASTFLLIAVAFYVMSKSVAVESEDFYIVSACVAMAAYVILFLMIRRHYRNTVMRPFKEKVLRRIIQLVDPDLEYRYDRCINTYYFLSSGLFPTSDGEIKGDDLINGKFEGVDFEFSDMQLKCYKSRIYDGESYLIQLGQWLRTFNKKNESRSKIFVGQFFRADFNKSIRGKTYIVPRRSLIRRKLLPDFYYPIQVPEVYVANQVFSKHFTIYANDAVEAQYILTPNFMELLLALRERLNLPFAATFIKNQLSIAIPTRKNQFEFRPSLFKTDYKFVEDIYKLIHIFYDIIQALQLNQKIWGNPTKPVDKQSQKKPRSQSNFGFELGLSAERRENDG